MPKSPDLPDLPYLQSAFAKAIRHGPNHVPFDAFEGDQQRVLMGFAVYANTISHGRLVALEDTFPRTLELIGQDAFNQHSRDFVEAGGGSDASLDDLGAIFPHWLGQHDAAQAALFARFEWAWLESYRAAEATPLSRQDLAELDEAGLLSMELARHPSAYLVSADPTLCEVLGMAENAAAILIARPDAEVLIHPAMTEATACFELLSQPRTVEHLLEALTEQFDDAAILPAILHLMDAGALTRPEL